MCLPECPVCPSKCPMKNIEKLSDKRAGDWNQIIVKKIYVLAMRCTHNKITERPFMHGNNGVFVALEDILLKIDEYET